MCQYITELCDMLQKVGGISSAAAGYAGKPPAYNPEALKIGGDSRLGKAIITRRDIVGYCALT